MALSVVQYPETTAQVAITSTVSVSLVKPADAERPERVPDEVPEE
jgi:hypothetical protein